MSSYNADFGLRSNRLGKAACLRVGEPHSPIVSSNTTAQHAPPRHLEYTYAATSAGSRIIVTRQHPLRLKRSPARRLLRTRTATATARAHKTTRMRTPQRGRPAGSASSAHHTTTTEAVPQIGRSVIRPIAVRAASKPKQSSAPPPPKLPDRVCGSLEMRQEERRHRRRQRIARRPSCTTRCGMRWHVSVCAARAVALSLLCAGRNVFGLGGVLPVLCFPVCSVRFTFLREDFGCAFVCVAVRSRVERCEFLHCFASERLSYACWQCTLSRISQYTEDEQATKGIPSCAPSHKIGANIQIVKNNMLET